MIVTRTVSLLLASVALFLDLECKAQEVLFPEEELDRMPFYPRPGFQGVPAYPNQGFQGRPPYPIQGSQGRPPFSNQVSEGPSSSFPSQVSPNPPLPSQVSQNSPSRPSQGSQGRPAFPGQGSSNQQSSQPQRPDSNTIPSTATPSPTETNATSTLIPPRDPGNRIVYIVSCPCTFLYQYNPVCGTDGQTYGNENVLQCAKFCGTDVEVYAPGACRGINTSSLRF